MPTVRNVKANIDWRSFVGDTVILPVCVRSPAMQGRNLSATLKALSEKVTSIHLVLIDTLDRYNFNNDFKGCRKRGDIWYNANIDQIKDHLSVKSFRRWDDILEDPTYKERLDKVTSLYQSNGLVRRMIQDNAMYFVEAMQKRELPFDRDEVFQNSVHYMIEEYAGTAVYGEALAYMPEAYWGIYVGNNRFFEQFNTGTKSLLLPETLPISINRLDLPFAGEAHLIKDDIAA